MRSYLQMNKFPTSKEWSENRYSDIQTYESAGLKLSVQVDWDSPFHHTSGYKVRLYDIKQSTSEIK